MKKYPLTIIIVLLLALMSVNDVVQAGNIPTISIVGVTEDLKVTIQTHNYPANREFDVRMGKFSTRGIGGILVGTFNSGTGGSQKFTFDIPPALYEEQAIAIRTDSKTGEYYSYNWFTNKTFGSHTGGTPVEGGKDTPAILVVTVKKDTFVTIEGFGFPDENFDVLMGKFNTQGVDGVKVGTLTPDDDGEIKDSFDIPESLKSESRIAIRVESTESDQAAHTWFLNETGAAGGAVTPSDPTYKGIPTISIQSVEADETVTVLTHNLPANKDFKVLMGKMGTKGVGGIQVETIASGSGGSFTKTFDIPDALKGDYRIAIRLQTSDGVFFAYNWFYNNTTAAPQPVPGYTGIPTFSISAVVEDETVTIKTNNFPANKDFKVLMGQMGTKGVGGIQIETINSGSGGSFTETFAIPAALAGEYRIAIRLESTTGGFYAYNWFFNNTYP